MKKHPVDDLFARNLTDWQPKVSPELWKRIEDRQEKKSRHQAGWYWYTAASVALLLMAGYVVWESQSALRNGTEDIAKIEQAQQPKLRDSAKPSQESTRKLTNGAVKQVESKTLVDDTNLPYQSPKVDALAESTVQPPKQQELDLISDRIEVAEIHKNETNPESLLPDIKPIASLPRVEAEPKITKESEADQDKGRVIIAHIETEYVIQEDPKSSKLIRILRQLKNAKQGEAIEWDEVGFNPKKLMARADERLRNEEEKVSKKYQELKEKTKL